MTNRIKKKRSLIDSKLITQLEEDSIKKAEEIDSEFIETPNKDQIDEEKKENLWLALYHAVACICIAFTAITLHTLNSSPFNLKEITDKLNLIRYGYSEPISSGEYRKIDVFIALENCRINTACKTHLIERIFNQEPNKILSTLNDISKEYQGEESTEKDTPYIEKKNQIKNKVGALIQDENDKEKISEIILRYDLIKEKYKTDIRDSFYENLTGGDYDAEHKLKHLKTFEIYKVIMKDESAGFGGARLIEALSQSRKIVEATE